MIINPKEKYGCEERVLIECDYKHTDKCKNQYTKIYKCIIKTRENTGGKDRCISCFNSMTKTSGQNYNYKYNKTENYFENIDTEEKAYLLGWVAGDGSIKKDGLFLSVHKKDEYICNLFLNATKSNSKIKYREYDNTANIRIHSVQIVKNLLKHLKLKSVGKKSNDIVLPDLPDDLIWHFIRGLIDSDGSIRDPSLGTISPACSYCSMSPKIRTQIVEFCNKFDIKCSELKSFPSIVWWGKNSLKFMSRLYDNSSFYLERKFLLNKEWQTWIPRKGTKNFKYSQPKYNPDSVKGFAWYKKRHNV